MRMKLGSRAHPPVHLALRKLRRAEVNHRQIPNVNFVARRVIAGVRNDSNNRNRNGFLVAVAGSNWIVYLSPDWIGARKEFLRGKFIDQDRCGTTTDICRPKIPAAQNRHPERAKVIRRNDRHFADRFLTGRIRRRASNMKRTVPFFVIERRVVANRRRANTWEASQLLEQLIVKTNDFLRSRSRGIARLRQCEGHGQNSTRIESQRHLLRTPKTLQG